MESTSIEVSRESLCGLDLLEHFHRWKHSAHFLSFPPAAIPNASKMLFLRVQSPSEAEEECKKHRDVLMEQNLCTHIRISMDLRLCIL